MMASAPNLPANHPHHLQKRQLTWVPNEVKELTYFHPDISGSEGASSLLKVNGLKAGSFILRLSSKGRGFLTFSINIGENHIHHVNVDIDEVGKQYYIVPELKFNNFANLRGYYSQHRIGNKEKIDNVKLLYPVNKRAVSYNKDAGFMRPNTIDNRNSNGSDIRSSGSINSDDQLTDPMFKRPPLPIPTTFKVDPGTYTHPHEHVNRLEELKAMLSNEKCDCGLSKLDSELGNGWAVHKSRESGNFGKLFYQNHENLTAWCLPDIALCKMSITKFEYLKTLHAESDQHFPYDEKIVRQLKDAMMY